MQNNYCVYKHTFPHGKVYIGITKLKPENRWRNDGKGYFYQSKPMFFAIKKYGWNNIKHDILFENLTKEEAWTKETELIALYDSTNTEKGYNVLEGPTSQGRKHSAETRQKIREAIKGKYTERVREKMRFSHKGKKRSEETKRRIGEANKGKKRSEETIQKMSDARRGKKQSEETIQKMSDARRGIKPEWTLKAVVKSVCQFDLNGTFINEFCSGSEAARKLGVIHSASISLVCSGKRKTAYGYIWRYKKDVEKEMSSI